MLFDFFQFLLESSVHTKVGVRLLVASLELAVLAGMLGLALNLLRVRSARFKALLWIFVLAKPILTLAAGSPIVVARIEIDPLPIPNTSVVREATPPGRPHPERLGDDIIVYNGIAIAPEPASHGGAAWFIVPLTSRTLLTCLALAWIVGICIGGTHWFIAGKRLGGILRRGVLPTERILNAYRDLLLERKIENPPLLLLSAEIESPVIFGAFRPTILLPVWLAENDEESLRNLLAHELAHHVHRDPLSLAFAKLSLVLFFFNPVTHWAFRNWMGCTEIACDRAVIRSNKGARDYAEQLLTVLEGMQSRQAALSGLYATRHQIGSRIDALLDEPMRSPAELSRVGAVGVFCFAVSLGFFGFGTETLRPIQGGDDGLFIGTLRDATADRPVVNFPSPDPTSTGPD